MVLIAVIDSVGGWFNPTFGVTSRDAPWQLTEEFDDYEIEVVGVEPVVDLIRVIYAGATAYIACAEARRAARAGARHGSRSMGFLFGAVAGVIQALLVAGRARSTRPIPGASRALVLAAPSMEIEPGPDPEPGEIDMHDPDAHIEDRHAPNPPVMVVESMNARAQNEALFQAGMSVGSEVVDRLVYGRPFAYSHLHLPPYL